MTYEIVWEAKAKKCLKKLETKWIREIIRKVRECGENPFLYLKKLKGDYGWRLRVGDFRVIMDIYTTENKINITSLGHRKDIYKETK